jgi:ABC-2 type transport system permease protein
MSAPADTLTTPASAAAAAPPRLPWTRLYAWSIRRELWENRSVYLAPAAVACVALLGSLLSTAHVRRQMTALTAGDLKAASGLMGPYAFSAAAIAFTGLLVSFFYCVGALYGERRDRSILFWKSLPVSDLITVAAKATIPLVVIPAVTLAAVYATQLLTQLGSSIVVVSEGFPLSLYWARTDLRLMWTMLAYGLVTLALWHAPVFGWLLMVSAWAKRSPILWAIVPPAAVSCLELIAVGSHHVWDFISDRLLGGGIVFTVHGDGKHPIERFDQISARIYGQPDLWLGLVVAALFLAAAVWLRRRREPL